MTNTINTPDSDYIPDAFGRPFPRWVLRDDGECVEILVVARSGIAVEHPIEWGPPRESDLIEASKWVERQTAKAMRRAIYSVARATGRRPIAPPWVSL